MNPLQRLPRGKSTGAAMQSSLPPRNVCRAPTVLPATVDVRSAAVQPAL